MSNPVSVERRGDVAYVSLSRPDKRNAVNFPMMEGLVDAARSLRKDRTLRAVVISGEGASFCAGLDFGSVTKQPAKIAKAFIKVPGRNTNLFQECAWAWRRLPVPVIAVLHGHCLGAGIQLALAADFRFATPDCQLSIMEAKWGLIPDMSGTVSLRELMPMDQAKLLTMTGRVLSGEEALRLGLVTAVSDDPMSSAEELIAELQTRSPDSVAATKVLFHETWSADEDDAFKVERKIQKLLLMGKNQKRAMKAAMKKAAASFGPRMRSIG